MVSATGPCGRSRRAPPTPWFSVVWDAPETRQLGGLGYDATVRGQPVSSRILKTRRAGSTPTQSSSPCRHHHPTDCRNTVCNRDICGRVPSRTSFQDRPSRNSAGVADTGDSAPPPHPGPPRNCIRRCTLVLRAMLDRFSLPGGPVKFWKSTVCRSASCKSRRHSTIHVALCTA